MTPKVSLPRYHKKTHSVFTLAESRRRGPTNQSKSRGSRKRSRKRLEPGKAVTPAYHVTSLPVTDVKPKVFSEKATVPQVKMSSGKTSKERSVGTPTKRPLGNTVRTPGVVRSASIPKLQTTLDGSVRIIFRPSGAASGGDGHGVKSLSQAKRNRRLDASIVGDKGTKIKATANNLDKTSRRINEQRQIIIANLRQATDLCRRYAKLTTLDQPRTKDMTPRQGRESSGNLKRRRSGQSRQSAGRSSSRPESCRLIKSSLRVQRCRSHSDARGGAKHVRFSLPLSAANNGKLAARSRLHMRQNLSLCLPHIAAASKLGCGNR